MENNKRTYVEIGLGRLLDITYILIIILSMMDKKKFIKTKD